MSWAAQAFVDLDLGDKRLNTRLVKLAETFARDSEHSGSLRRLGRNTRCVPLLLQGVGLAGYSEPALAMHPHTHERAPGGVVPSGHLGTGLRHGQGISGLGRLSYEAQRGMYLHPTYVVTPDRERLGVLDLWMWARAEKGSEAAASEPSESTRWIEGYERVAEQAAELPGTRLVYVADREGDILELMQRAQSLEQTAGWLVRSQHNRALPGGGKLWDRVSAGEPLGIRFTLKARPGQRAREVRQAVWMRRVTLAKSVEVTCVVAKEIAPPAGVSALEWRLLSNRPEVSFEAAVELIDWYRARWEIELFFHILKNACRIEAMQLSTMERLERAIALYAVVAWRIGRLMRLGRTCPDLPGELFFEPDEWKGAHVLLKKPVPATPPTLKKIIRLVATLGGFLGRKSDGEPGVKTLWLGLQRVTDFAAGLRYAREADRL